MKINDYIYKCDAEAVAYDLKSMGCEGTAKDLEKKLEEAFFENKDNLFVFSRKVGIKNCTYYIFETGLYFRNSDERILAYTMKNTDAASDCDYFGLFVLRERLLRNRLQTRLHLADIFFDDINEMNSFVDELASRAVREEWHFSTYRAKISNPILKNFIEQSLVQAQLQGKAVRNEEEEKILFNTGLVDSEFRELFIRCDIVKDDENDFIFKEHYENPMILLASDKKLYGPFGNNTPLPATFYESLQDLMFDIDATAMGVDLCEDHIFKDNLRRINATLPREKQYSETNLAECKADFARAVELSLILARRNYKLVTPQFWPETGSIQFLLPVYLSFKCKGAPNVALCLEKEGGAYIGKSILNLDMSYQNARLIAKPDSFWLNPSYIYEEAAETKTAEAPVEENAVEERACEKACEEEKKCIRIGDVVKFKFGKAYCHTDENNENKIVAVLGYVDGRSSLMPLAEMGEGFVTQEAARAIVELCEKQDIDVRVIDDTEKGLVVSLKR